LKIEGIEKADAIYLPNAFMKSDDKKRVDDEMDSVYTQIKKMDVPNNKFLLIRMMSRSQVLKLLRYLNKNQLLAALNLFPKNMLMKLMFQLPQEMMLAMLLRLLPIEDLIKLFPSSILINMLRTRTLDISMMMMVFAKMNDEILRHILTQITGRPLEGVNQGQLLAMLFHMDKGRVVESMKDMPQNHLENFIILALKKNPDMLMNIPKGALGLIIEQFPKPMMIEMCSILDEALLVNFISILPEKLMALAASSIDDNIFESLLASQFGNLVALLAA
jgi:hypothetical protein